VTVSRERGLRLIIAYKLAKAFVALALSAAIVILLLAHDTSVLGDLAVHVRHHVAGAWSVMLVRAIGTLSTRGHLWLIAGAVGLDGLFTAVEGWALYREKTWGPWLVLIATSMLLPFEVIAIVRFAHLGRVLVFIVNVVIVVYLVRRIRSSLARPSHVHAS
jgi:uncharacterized membrane protein (DUF2068 family)